MADTVDQIMAQLDQYYKPQSDIVNSQLAALPGQTAQQVAGLDQAKTNAFSDITSQANQRGMTYSGLPISEQAKYTGATYLPALANLQKAQTDQTTSLQGKLAEIQAQKGTQAMSIRNDQLKQEQAAAEAEANRQQQMQIEQMRIANQRSSSSSRGGGSGAGGKYNAQDIINYYVTAPSQYGNYNPNGSNLHRWQAAADDLAAHGIPTNRGSQADKILRQVFNQGQ